MNCSPQLLSCPASTSSEEERVEKRKGYKGERAKKPKKHFVVFSWHEQINDLHFTAGDTIQSIKVKSWGTSSHRHRTHTHTHKQQRTAYTHWHSEEKTTWRTWNMQASCRKSQNGRQHAANVTQWRIFDGSGGSEWWGVESWWGQGWS